MIARIASRAIWPPKLAETVFTSGCPLRLTLPRRSSTIVDSCAFVRCFVRTWNVE